MGALAYVQSWAKARWGTQLEAGWPNGQNRFVAMYARVPKSGIGARSYSQERMHARRGTQNPAGVPGGRRNDALSHAPASGGKLGAAAYKRACLCARTSKAAGSIVWLHCRASRKASRRHRVNPQQMVDALRCGAQRGIQSKVMSKQEWGMHMGEWIIKRASGDRARVGALAGMVCIVANVLLCAAKAAVGVMSGSVSIVADAINNLSDASSNIVSVLGFKLASRPADPEHPYGHGRYEYLSGLAVAVLVLLVAVELIKSSIDKIVNPTQVEFSLALVAVLTLSILVKCWMAAFNRSLGNKIDSETLIATAQDSTNDCIATGAVLLSAVVARVTSLQLDAWAGLAVGAYIAWSGVELLRDTVDPLLGSAPDPKLVAHIRSKIMSYPGVLGTHDLMVHDYGPGRQFASAHVEMAAETNPMDSHDVLDNIEQAFKDDDGLIVTLHYDPIVTDDPAVTDMRNRIDAIAKEIDPRLSIHDLRTVPGPTHTNVIFDCLRPEDMRLSSDELRSELARRVVKEYPQAVAKITVDDDYVSACQ